MNLLETEKKVDCLGRIYRGRVNAYIGSRNEYLYQEKMVYLKSKSCKVCKYCGFLEDDLYEWTVNGTLPIIKNIEDGALYKLEVTNIGYDYETGYCDDWSSRMTQAPFPGSGTCFPGMQPAPRRGSHRRRWVEGRNRHPARTGETPFPGPLRV